MTDISVPSDARHIALDPTHPKVMKDSILDPLKELPNRFSHTQTIVSWVRRMLAFTCTSWGPQRLSLDERVRVLCPILGELVLWSCPTVSRVNFVRSYNFLHAGPVVGTQSTRPTSY